MRAGLLGAITVVGAFVAACGKNTPTGEQSTVSKAVVCARGALSPGNMVNGHLDSASTCKRLDGLTGETTYTAAFSLSLRPGQGALVTMAAPSPSSLSTLLQLVSPSDTLRAVSPHFNGPTHLAPMLIASEIAEKDTIFATTFDSLASDTGAYTITVQSCKVPVAPLVQPTDSITHSDMLTPGDCAVGLSDFFVNGLSGQVFVHLYPLHFSQQTTVRRVTVTASEPVWLLMGPQDDALGQLGLMEYLDGATTHPIADFGGSRAGEHVLVVASAGFASYTLTIGTEQPIPGAATVMNHMRGR